MEISLHLPFLRIFALENLEALSLSIWNACESFSSWRVLLQTQECLSQRLLEASLGNMIEEDSTSFLQFLWEGRSLVYFVQSQLANPGGPSNPQEKVEWTPCDKCTVQPSYLKTSHCLCCEHGHRDLYPFGCIRRQGFFPSLQQSLSGLPTKPMEFWFKVIQ